MPLTQAEGTEEVFDPYEETEPATPTSEEETQVVDDEPEPEVDPVAEELARLKKQVSEQASHIGRLEGENKGFRTAMEQFGKPAVQPEPETDPFDDPATKDLIRRAFEEDPVEAQRLVGKMISKRVDDLIEKRVKPVRESTEQDRQMQRLQQQINAELLQASQDYGQLGAEIVTEYAQNQGASGRLADKILARGQYLKGLGYDPTGAVAPGNFRSAIAEIIAESGTPVARTSSPPASPRPKGANRPVRPEPTTEKPDEAEAFADQIVNTKDVRAKMADMLK